MAKINLSCFHISMKISNIKVFNYNLSNPRSCNNPVPNQLGSESGNSLNMDHMELLGRSQVRFTGDEYGQPNEFDRTFFGEMSKKLNLSNEDANKFRKIVNRFLKTNNYSSVENFCKSDVQYEQIDSFVEKVAIGLNLSDKKIDTFANSLIDIIALNRITEMLAEDEALVEDLIPILTNSIKHGMVCDNLIQKFNLDPDERENIVSHLQKLNQGTSPEQVAYEFTEKYHLSSFDDYKYTLETINSANDFLEEFLEEGNTDDDV